MRLPAPRRHDLDDRQGRHRDGSSLSRSAPAPARIRESFTARSSRSRRACLRTSGRPRDARGEGNLKKLAPESVKATALAGEPIVARLTRAPATGRTSAGSRWWQRTAGSRRARRAPRMSTRSTRRARDDAHLARIPEEARAIGGSAEERRSTSTSTSTATSTATPTPTSTRDLDLDLDLDLDRDRATPTRDRSQHPRSQRAAPSGGTSNRRRPLDAVGTARPSARMQRGWPPRLPRPAQPAHAAPRCQRPWRTVPPPVKKPRPSAAEDARSRRPRRATVTPNGLLQDRELVRRQRVDPATPSTP